MGEDTEHWVLRKLKRKGSLPTVLLGFVATVLTFFIAGLLFICALSTSITWERTPHPVRRPAFSSHLTSTVTIPVTDFPLLLESEND